MTGFRSWLRTCRRSPLLRRGTMLVDVSEIHFRRVSTLTCFESLSSSGKRRASAGAENFIVERGKTNLVPRPADLPCSLMTNQKLYRSYSLSRVYQKMNDEYKRFFPQKPTP